MLEIMASPEWVRWVSLALVALSAAVLVPGTIRGWGATALAFGLLCAGLAVLASSHYLLFTWASDSYLALPGLLLGLPLIYLGSFGLLARRQPRRPLGAVLVLTSGLLLLLVIDDQQLWPATFYRLQGALMGYPDLVLRGGEDLGQSLPPAGTRLIFKPAQQTLSCGLLSDPEPSYASLSYRLIVGTTTGGRQCSRPSMPPCHPCMGWLHSGRRRRLANSPPTWGSRCSPWQ